MKRIEFAVTLSEATTLQILEIEAVHQALRAELGDSRRRRDAALYAAWRETCDPCAAARALPSTITAAAVRAAVLRIAPPGDFARLLVPAPRD